MKIYSGITDKPIKEIEAKYSSSNIKSFKEDLAEVLIKELYPIHLKATDILVFFLILE